MTKWHPTKAEASLLVDLLVARMPKAKIAEFLHIDERTLAAYMHRLSAAADAPYPDTPMPLPMPPQPPKEPLHRYVAEFDFRYSNRVALGTSDIERAEKLAKGSVGKRLT